MAKALRGWIRTLLWNPDTRPNDQRFDFAIAKAREALALPDTDIEAQAYAGYILAFLGQDIEFGLSLIEHAVASCPNCASAWGSSCILYGLKGDVPRALAHGEEALRLNPADPLGYRVYMGMSLAHIGDRNWTALRETAERARAGSGASAHGARAGFQRFAVPADAHPGPDREAGYI